MTDLPLKIGIIYETIVTTSNLNDLPNAASMGILLDSNEQIIIQPYCSSDTYQNIRDKGICGINFTLNPKLFTLATLFQEELKEDSFKIETKFKVPLLSDCVNRFIIVKINNKDEPFNERAAFRGEIVKSNFKSEVYQPFTRAFSLLIEVLIHASRIISFKEKEDLQKEIPDLLEKIELYSRIIRRITSENSLYLEQIEKITTKINAKNY